MLQGQAASHRRLLTIVSWLGKEGERERRERGGYVELTLSFPLLRRVFLEALLGKFAFSLLYPLLLRPIELL